MLRRTAMRFGWGIADQALSSLTNFALGVAVARSVSAEDFGAYAIVFSVYLVALNVTRHLSIQPIAIRYATADAATWRTVTGSATGLVVVLAVAMGALLVVAGLVLGGTLGWSFVALGVTLTGLLLQDAWRLAFFAGGRGASAFVNDAVWTVVLFGGFVILEAQGMGRSLVDILLLWGIAGSAAAIVGVLQARVVPVPARARAWWREHRDIGPRYLASELVQMASTQLVIVIVGVVAGLAAAGSLRAAQLLLGPMNILLMGVYFVGLPAGARLYAERPERLRAAAAAVGLVMGATTMVLAIFVVVFPDFLGPLLLGESWPGAALVFVPVAIGLVGHNAGFGPRMGLLAMAQARRTLRLTVIESVLALVAGTIGAVVLAASGAAWGIALVTLALAVVWWREFEIGLRSPEERIAKGGALPGPAPSDASA